MITIYTTEQFDKWFLSLKDKQAKVRVQVRIDRAELGNLGDHKAVGSGVFEMRITYGPGYRVYFKKHGHEIVVLLAGGDKSTQSNDIATAIQLTTELELET